MRVLAVVLPEPGHFHAFIGLAQTLERAGHEVHFFCADDLTARLTRAGLRATCRSLSAATPDAPSVGPRSVAYTERLQKPAWARRWYARVLLSPVAAQVDALTRLIRELAPDVIVTDPSTYAGGIAAMQADLPWASIAPSLVVLSPAGFRSPYHDSLAAQATERDALFASFGLAMTFKVGEMISPWLNTVFATEALSTRADADNVFSHYVGPSSPVGARGDEPEFPWDRLNPALPLVYASFGTQVSPPAPVFAAIANALEPGEAQLVLALNDRIDDAFVAALPPHVIAVRYAPQLALLDRAAVMVTHGGANGVTEGLQRGIPMLVIPLAHEQALQAHLVERGGVGRALAGEDATVDRCRAELRHLLAPGSHRTHADRLRRSYAATDAGAQICDALVSLARSRQPIPMPRPTQS